MIRFACSCGRELQAPEGLIGSQARCPICEELQVVPREDEVAPFHGMERLPSETAYTVTTLTKKSAELMGRELRKSRRTGEWSVMLGTCSLVFSMLSAVLTPAPALLVGIGA